MANISVTIPDDLMSRVRKAVRARYPEFDDLGPRDAIKAALGVHLRSLLVEAEAVEAEQAAWESQKDAVRRARVKAEADGDALVELPAPEPPPEEPPPVEEPVP